MTPIVALLEGIGGPELMLIGVLALLMFGSKRLPELGKAFGRAMREFKRATSGVEENLREVMRDDPLRPKIRPPQHRGPARSVTPPAPVAPGPVVESTPNDTATADPQSAQPSDYPSCPEDEAQKKQFPQDPGNYAN